MRDDYREGERILIRVEVTERKNGCIVVKPCREDEGVGEMIVKEAAEVFTAPL